MTLMINQAIKDVVADAGAGVISHEEYNDFIQLRTLLTVEATAEYIKPLNVTLDDLRPGVVIIEFEVKFQYFNPLRGVVTTNTTYLLNQMLTHAPETIQGIVRYLHGCSRA